MSTENNNFRFTAGEETPVHGHTELTEEQVEAVNEQLRDIADVPAIEIISSAAIHMMSAALVTFTRSGLRLRARSRLSALRTPPLT